MALSSPSLPLPCHLPRPQRYRALSHPLRLLTTSHTCSHTWVTCACALTAPMCAIFMCVLPLSIRLLSLLTLFYFLFLAIPVHASSTPPCTFGPPHRCHLFALPYPGACVLNPACATPLPQPCPCAHYLPLPLSAPLHPIAAVPAIAVASMMTPSLPHCRRCRCRCLHVDALPAPLCRRRHLVCLPLFSLLFTLLTFFFPSHTSPLCNDTLPTATSPRRVHCALTLPCRRHRRLHIHVRALPTLSSPRPRPPICALPARCCIVSIFATASPASPVPTGPCHTRRVPSSHSRSCPGPLILQGMHLSAFPFFWEG